MTISSKGTNIIWVLVAALFFIPFLGNVHLFDWDEINFAEIAREMCVTGKYNEPQINFQFFTEKPPLFFWLQAASMKLFGINEFAARFPNALLGLIVLPFLYSIGRKVKDNTLGMLWVLVYFGTILPHLYFKSGIIDPWFNFFIFTAIYSLIRASWKKQTGSPAAAMLVAGGIFLGLAILTKGPVALLVTGLVFFVYWAMQKFRMFISWPQLFLFGCTALLVTGVWLGVNYLQNGSRFITEFTIRQWELLTTEDAGHGGFFLYHFVVLFFGCFPASVFCMQSLFKRQTGDAQLADFKKWMSILFWVVLVLFTVVKTKIVHYSSLCYFPMTFLAALSFYNIIQKKWQWRSWMKWLLIVSALPFIIAPFAFAWFGRHIDELKPLLSQDPFAVENLQAKIHWSGWEFVPGLILLLVLILFFVWMRLQRFGNAIHILFIGGALYTQLMLFFLIKRIEGYSQRANIEFWQSHAREDCYMATFSYKSYTQYFYGEMKPQENKNYTDINWLTKGAVDKPVYISCRVEDHKWLEHELKDALFLYNSNGFYFYKRLPK